MKARNLLIFALALFLINLQPVGAANENAGFDNKKIDWYNESRSVIESVYSHTNEIGIKSSNKIGDGQTIYSGQSATVSLQLDGDSNGANPHTYIIINVYGPNSSAPIETYTIYNPPLKPETIAYTWHTSSYTPPGTYRIIYHYPASPLYNDIFTINVQARSLPAPSNLIVTSSQNSITMEWDKVNGADFYHVKLNDDLLHTLPSTVNRYTFNGLDANREYDVGVATSNGNERSIYNIKRISTKKEIVFFIPGIAGTRLKEGSRTVWTPSVSRLSDDLDQLLLDNNGVPINNNVKVDKPLPEFYSNLIVDLQNAGYDVVEFGYDFRLGNAYNSFLLEQKINEKIMLTGVDKVSIVAHSMGGLIATKYIVEGNSSKIEKLITLGTPFLGAPKSLYIMKTGNFLGDYKDIFVNDHLRKIAMRAQSVYELLPTQNYFGYNVNEYYAVVTYNHRWNEPSVTEHLKNYNDTREYIRYNVFVNSIDRLTEAETFHSGLDLLNSLTSVDSYIIVGENIATPGKIFVNDYRHKYDFNPINGDGTVPIISSTIASKLPGKLYFIKEEHSKLANNSLVKQQVLSILGNRNTNVLSRTRSSSNKTIKIKVECPVELHVYDKFGGHLGPTLNSLYEENIPFGSYYQDGDVKFAFVEYGNYDVKLIGTDFGSMTFTIQLFDANDNPEKTIRFDDVQLTPSTIIDSSTDFADGIKLMLDVDGDGNIDEVIPPSLVMDADESQDYIAPTVNFEISGTLQNEWYTSDVQVEIVGQDSGSGINHIEYKIGDNEPQRYSTPLIFDQEGKNVVYAIAYDNNGNSSLISKSIINIDKFHPTDPIIHTNHADWTNQDVIISIDGSEDSGSGVSKYQYKIGNAEWRDYSDEVFLSTSGEYVVSARAMDRSGKISNIVTQTIKIDKQIPTSPILMLSSSEWTTNDVLISLEHGNDTHSGVFKSQVKIGELGEWRDYTAPIKVIDEGSINIYARTIDYVGNISMEVMKIARIDKSPPTHPNLYATATGWSKRNVKISILNGNDLGSGVNFSQYKIGMNSEWIKYTSPFEISTEGESEIFARTIDKLGQISDIQAHKVLIDKTPPFSPLIQLSTFEWTNSDVVLRISGGLDTLSGLDKIQYKIGDEGEWIDYIDEVVIDRNGEYSIYAKSIDLAGNESEIVSSGVRIDKRAPEKPTIRLSNTEWSNSKVYFTIMDGVDHESGVFKSQYKISDNGTWMDYSLAVPITTEGQTKVFSRTIDNMGNISEEVFETIRIDLTIPSVPTSLRLLSEGSAEIDLTWEASTDNTFIKGYEIYRNNSYIGYSGATNYKVTGLVSNTNYTFTVRARDAAGNFSGFSNELIVIIQ